MSNFLLAFAPRNQVARGCPSYPKGGKKRVGAPPEDFLSSRTFLSSRAGGAARGLPLEILNLFKINQVEEPPRTKQKFSICSSSKPRADDLNNLNKLDCFGLDSKSPY